MKIINMYKCQICGNIIEEVVHNDKYSSLWGYVDNINNNHFDPGINKLCVPEDRNHIGIAYCIGSKEEKEVDVLSDRYHEIHRGLTPEERRKYVCVNLFNNDGKIIVDGESVDIESLDMEKRYETIRHYITFTMTAFLSFKKPLAFGLFNRELYGMDIDKITDIIKNCLKILNCEVIICNDFRCIG